MTKRRFGPPRHEEDPYTKLTSPRGIPVDQLVSVLQKEIRRGNVDNAVLAAYEMLSTSEEVTAPGEQLAAYGRQPDSTVDHELTVVILRRS